MSTVPLTPALVATRLSAGPWGQVLSLAPTYSLCFRDVRLRVGAGQWIPDCPVMSQAVWPSLGREGSPTRQQLLPSSWEEGQGRGSSHQVVGGLVVSFALSWGWGRGHTLLLLQGPGQATPLQEAKLRFGGKALPRGSEPHAQAERGQEQVLDTALQGRRGGGCFCRQLPVPPGQPHRRRFTLWAQAGQEGTAGRGGW